MNPKLSVVVPELVEAGLYKIRLLNITDKKQSKDTPINLQIYDKNYPYIKGILNKQLDYKPAQAVVFNTSRFEQIPTRFYQCQMTNGKDLYIQNGIYDSQKQRLSITLPTIIKTGQYQISLRFLATSGVVLYEIITDEQITIN